MKKIILNKVSKETVAQLPQVVFDGRIITILTESEAEKAVDYLLSQPVLGFDTETRPAFKKGVSYKVALLQVSTEDTCFLFRLNLIGLCPAVVRLLEDTTVLKIGLSWHDDLRMLRQRGQFNAGTFIELQQMVREIGIEDMSLQKIYANLFQQKISKRQRLTNWESAQLDEKQKTYAAIDAWACIMIYKEVKTLRESNNFILEKNEETTTVQGTPEAS